MSRVVHKHPLVIDRDCNIRVPRDTVFIHFDFQDRTPTVWSNKPMGVDDQIEYTLRVVGTGWEISDDWFVPVHVGTAIIDWFVWHLFVVGIRSIDQ